MSSSAAFDIPKDSRTPIPPDSIGGSGDDGGGDWKQNNSGPPISMPRVGLLFVIAGAVMLFAAFITSYVVLRFSAEAWPPPGSPALPSTLWWSTALIALSSVPAHLAVKAAKNGASRPLQGMIAATLILGLGFCVLQGAVWDGLVEAGLTLRSSQLGSNFYCLTILHVVHVVGGIAYLAVAFRDALMHRFTSTDHERVANCMIYWHFVGILWYALFAALFLI